MPEHLGPVDTRDLSPSSGLSRLATVLKPHGSIHFFRLRPGVAEASSGRQIVAVHPRFDIEFNPATMRRDIPEVSFWRWADAVPLIVPPLLNKDSMLSSDYFQEILSLCVEALRAADAVVCIGSTGALLLPLWGFAWRCPWRRGGLRLGHWHRLRLGHGGGWGRTGSNGGGRGGSPGRVGSFGFGMVTAYSGTSPTSAIGSFSPGSDHREKQRDRRQDKDRTRRAEDRLAEHWQPHFELVLPTGVVMMVELVKSWSGEEVGSLVGKLKRTETVEGLVCRSE